MAITMEMQGEFKAKPLIPAGEHDLRLTSIEKKRIKSSFAKDSEDGKVDKFVWVFTSKQTFHDEEADEVLPYELVLFTGTKYGNEKAALTLLLAQLVPDMDEKVAKGFDLEDLIGCRFKALIRHTKDKNDPKKKYANAVYITPATAASKTSKKAAPAKVEDDDDEDAFADD